MDERHQPTYKLTELTQINFARAQGYNPDALTETDMDMLRQRWNIVKGGNATMLAWPNSKED